MTELISLNACFEDTIIQATYGMNSLLKKSLAGLEAPLINNSSSKIFEAKLDCLQFPDENSRSLLMHLLFNEQFTAISQRHGMTATSSTISIHVDKFHIFEATEFFQFVEHFERKGEQYLMVTPISCTPQCSMPNIQKIAKHLHRAEQRVTSLQETIHRLEAEVNMRRDSERILEEALRSQLEKDVSKCKNESHLCHFLIIVKVAFYFKCYAAMTIEHSTPRTVEACQRIGIRRFYFIPLSSVVYLNHSITFFLCHLIILIF